MVVKIWSKTNGYLEHDEFLLSPNATVIAIYVPI